MNDITPVSTTSSDGSVRTVNGTETPIHTKVGGRTMRAIVHRRYGTPDALAVEDVARPVPGIDDVLVQIHAAVASVGDHHVITGTPFLIRLTPFGGFPRPRHQVPGTTMAGRVDAVGANVTTFRRGDEIYGDASNGAFAEYAIVSPKRIALKPANLSFEEAAAAAWGVTALQGLRDAGQLRAGQRVLINGASGGVGTWAVQIAKALGAHVTAVCSQRNVDMVRALGADEVIDYAKEDFVAGGARFDLMFDTVGNHTVSDCRRVLLPKGTYVSCAGGSSSLGWLSRLAVVHLTSLVSRQKLTSFVASPNHDDLNLLRELIEAKDVKPVIEQRYALSNAAGALVHVGLGHAQGQTVIQIA